MRSGTVENLHDFKGKLDKIKELKIFKKIYAVTLDKCGGKIQRGFTIEAKKEHPREFEDYEISWDVEGCKQPEEF